MKVAITGATGLVGSHCTAAALAAGHDVRMVVRVLQHTCDRAALFCHAQPVCFTAFKNGFCHSGPRVGLMW